jgi:hypothetical protein
VYLNNELKTLTPSIPIQTFKVTRTTLVNAAVGLGFGRIVTSEIEAPNMLVNLVQKRMRDSAESDNATKPDTGLMQADTLLDGRGPELAELPVARNLLVWSKICRLARAFMRRAWEDSANS